MTSIDSSVIEAVRTDLLLSIEDLGGVSTLLREALGDCQGGNIPGAKMAAGEAAELLDEMARRFAVLSQQVEAWAR